jgi:hypothetical protein
MNIEFQVTLQEVAVAFLFVGLLLAANAAGL